MTRTLSKKAERLRHLGLLLAVLFGFATANAQLSSDDINMAILEEGVVPVKWTNDAQHPWYIAEDGDGTYMRTPETKEDSNFVSTLSFTYTSDYPTLVSWIWYKYYRHGDILQVYIDGELKDGIGLTEWTPTYGPQNPMLIPAGDHKIDFVSHSTFSDVDNPEYWGGIRSVRVTYLKELEPSALKTGSLPITFDNDKDNTWIALDGYIRSKVQNADDTTSKISTTFTIDQPSMFTFEWRNSSQYGNEVALNITIDGVPFKSYTGETWSYQSLALYPGEHTVEFEHWHDKSYPDRWTELRNIQLDQTWYSVVLSSPGDLRTRLLQALNGKNFQDAELVKIAGEMNDDDWNTIKQLTNIKAIDFTDALITKIPDEACRGLGSLSTVILPATLKEIGNNAFYQTDFHSLTIPAGIERIGWEAWFETPLQFVDFEENSNLKYIGYQAFAYTRIIEFIMPDSVEMLGRYQGDDNSKYYASNLFQSCKSLKKLHLSNGLQCIPAATAGNCESLVDLEISNTATVIENGAFFNTAIRTVSLPETLLDIEYSAFRDTDLESIEIPRNVRTLGSGAFAECSNLKNVILNSLTWNMASTFHRCEAIETILLPSPTPPSISSDPFEGLNKDNVKLMVPDFAINAYRGDSYWYQFSRNISSSEEASQNDYWGIRGNLVLDTEHVIQGTPSLEVFTGGSITFENDTPQNFDAVIYNTNESAPSSFLSKSNTVNANSLVAKFEVERADRWYFFSPVTDVRMSDVSYSSTDSWVIRYYDGARRASENSTSGNWVNVPSDGTLKRGQGYIIQALAPGWFTMPASASEHVAFFGNNEVTIPLDDNACETEENTGWNFVANPYPCYYDIYYINMEAPVTVWDGDTYRAYSLSDGDDGENTLVLRPMQPFFVQKATADLTAGMTLDGRRTSDVIDRTRAPRPVVIDENRHKLNLEFFRADKEKADDYTSIVLNENASMAYERVRDASKFMSMNAEVAQLYSLGDTRHPMAINERPYSDGNVALGVYLPKDGETYRIAARRADRRAWIFDNETGIEQDLTEGDYVFTASKTGIDNKRFSIRFAPAANAVDGMEVSAVKVTGNIGSISVTAPADATVAVYGTDGSTITNTTADKCNLEIAVSAGVYVVKVNGESFKTIVK